MNLTQRPPNIPITPTMSTCADKKPAQSPPAALPAKPAPPAAQQITCAANAHLDLPSQNPSQNLCRKQCRKHQNAPFARKLCLIFKKNRDKTSPYLSCHDRSHQYPVTEQKILAKNQHLLTSFAAIRYPFDTLPVCPQPPAMEAAASRPGHSWARPAPPSPRAAAPPARSSSPSSTTVSRAEMLHSAAWPQVRFFWRQAHRGASPRFVRRRPQWLFADSSVASQRLSQTYPHLGMQSQSTLASSGFGTFAFG